MKPFFGTMLAVVVSCYLFSGWKISDSKPTPEGMARKVDKILDREQAKEKLTITQEDLQNHWPQEIAPYFEYEMLTNGEAKPPVVKFFSETDAFRNFHVMGYTFTFDEDGDVFLNGRFGNPVSPKFEGISILATLIHETAHIQKGDFMAGEDAEKNAQLATLEVLAAMSNAGNKYARQALLDELRDIYTGVALHKAIKSGDLKSYEKLVFDLTGKKSGRQIRQWQNRGLKKLVQILEAYDVSVYEDMQDYQFIAKAEGDKSPRVFLMDDLKEFIENL